MKKYSEGDANRIFVVGTGNSDWGSLTYGVLFLTILGEYLGIPIPSSMVLIVSGTLVFQGHLDLLIVFFLALVAASLGDGLWFVIGKMRGESFLKGYCRLSLGSKDCVRRTREMFLRFPRTSLLLGKFVPGLSTFVVPVAGNSGMGYTDFVRNDTAGILLWTSSMIAIGYTFGEWIQRHAARTENARWYLFAAVVVFIAFYYAIKIWRLRKFGRVEIAEIQ